VTQANPYRRFVTALVDTFVAAKLFPLGGIAPPETAAPAAGSPTALIFAPHPDDECVIGGLPLRLKRELGFDVVNVAVTQGGRADRRADRWQELSAGCAYLGFGLLATGEGGLTDIKPEIRDENAAHWQAAVGVIAAIIAERRPDVVFFPHDDDWNRTHLGTHLLLVDALARLPQDFACHVVETEFWGAMDDPNLMIEIGTDDLADLLAALSCHVGEVRRNPYHLRLPGWMMDNVRRGGELVLGQGGRAPDFTFATLYRLRRWRDGGLRTVLDEGRAVSETEDLATLFSR
jgi:LmbE family N-acetylglucosaminyl deacetylase